MTIAEADPPPLGGVAVTIVDRFLETRIPLTGKLMDVEPVGTKYPPALRLSNGVVCESVTSAPPAAFEGAGASNVIVQIVEPTRPRIVGGAKDKLATPTCRTSRFAV